MTSEITGLGNAAGFVIPQRGSVRKLSKRAGSKNRFAAWLALIGLILPAWEIQVQIAGGKFTVGRAGIALLLLPAIVAMCRSGRRLLLADLCAALTAIWSIGISIYSNGTIGLQTVTALNLEFVGAYAVGRAFFYDVASLDTFVRVLKTLSVAALLLAIADSMSGRWIAHDIASALSGMPPLSPVFRGGLIRATSSFDHPILFGVFCSVVAAILLFWENNPQKRALGVGLFLLGCILSQSSASLMCIALIVAGYAYEHLMRRVSYRWTLFWIAIAGALAVIILITQHPLGWLISHLTLDPVTGYYRILIWDAALERISQNPMGGHTGLFNQEILDATIDSVWLVLALGSGVPMVVLVILTNLTAIWSNRRTANATNNYEFISRMRFAFSIVLLTFMFSGLTVHFWNYTWIFWGLCIGIRASLGEGAADLQPGRLTVVGQRG